MASALRMPVHPIAHQHDRGARQLRVPEADDQPDFAKPGETHGQRKRPVGGVPSRHRPGGRARDQRDQRFYSDRRPFQGDGVSRRVLQDEAVGLQIPILFQQADPVFVPVTSHSHQLFREIPTVEQEDTKRDLVLNRRLQEGNAQVNLRPKLLVQLLKGRVLPQDGVNCLMKLRPFLFLRRDGAVGEVFVDHRFPLGEFFLAAIQPEVHGKAHGTTHVRAGHRIVRERIRVVTVIVRAVHIVEQTPHVFA
jgi:hypothetical protein